MAVRPRQVPTCLFNTFLQIRSGQALTMDADTLLKMFAERSGFTTTQQKSLGQGVNGTSITMDDAGMS